jgi:peptide/nickel transport system permease protein
LILARFAAMIGVLVAVSGMLFFAVEILPGDAATTILGQNASPERLEAVRDQLDLDRSPVVRYVDWLADAMRGDLGRALITDRSVWSTIEVPVRNSVVLAGGAFICMAALALALGTVAGHRPGSAVDGASSAMTSLAASVPDFVLGTILIAVFATWWGVAPAVSLVPAGASPWDDPAILVLPVATMALVAGSYGARLVRAIVADASSSPHVDAARLAGLPAGRVLRRHVLPAAIGPLAQVVASLVPAAIGGTIVVERLFGYPGLGSAFTAQLAARDVAVVEAIGLLFAAVTVVALFMADVIGMIADPHTRSAGVRPSRRSA